MRRLIFVALVTIGIVLGLWHLRLALGAIFVFREGEPLSSWLFIVFGPGSTLLCALVGAWRPLIGGCMLVGLAIASAIVFAITEHGVTETLLAETKIITLPMLLLGVALMIYARRFRQLHAVTPNVATGA